VRFIGSLHRKQFSVFSFQFSVFLMLTDFVIEE
jgi:hypothetical protein